MSNANGAEEGGARTTCIFCQICDGKAEANILYQDVDVIAFADIRPAAKHHYLIAPKKHIKNAKILKPEDISLVENLVSVGKQVLGTVDADLENTRIGFHWPPCNTISHLHLHVISPASEMNFISRLMFREGMWFVSPEYVIQRLKSQL